MHVDMGKFVNERLHEVALGRGAGASILASRMSKLKVKDITDLNKVIAQVKAKAGLTPQLLPHTAGRPKSGHRNRCLLEELRRWVFTGSVWSSGL